MVLAEFQPDQTNLKKFGFKNPLESLAVEPAGGKQMAKDKEKKDNKGGENRPEHKIRVGNVTATIWKNVAKRKDGEKFDAFNTDIVKNYIDKDEEWQTTSSFGLNDLPKVIAAAQKAFEFIAVKEETAEDDD